MRLVLPFLLLLTVAVGALAPLDLMVAKPWLIARPSRAKISLGMTRDDLALPAGEDMVSVDPGLTVRFRAGRVVNIIASEDQTITLGGKLVCQVGETAQSVQDRLGAPHARFVKAEFVNTEMWYFPGARADLGALMQNGQLKSFLLTEPGLFEPTLMVAGYQRLR